MHILSPGNALRKLPGESENSRARPGCLRTSQPEETPTVGAQPQTARRRERELCAVPAEYHTEETS